MNELGQTRVFSKKKPSKNDSRKVRAVSIMTIFVLLTIYLMFFGGRKSSVKISTSAPFQPTFANNFGWPKKSSAAVGLIDGNSVSCRTNGSADPHPTASVAKIITALVLSENVSNPDHKFEFSEKDVQIYHQILALNGSNLPVMNGEKLAFREVIEGILIVSADNLADSAVNDVFGDFENYRKAAENWLRKHGLNSTKIGDDASGLDAGSASTPADLCKLVSIALKNPLISEIMGEKTAILSTGQRLFNTNETLDEQGIFAGKTGHTDEAGYNLVASAKVGGQTVISVLLGQDSYESVFEGTKNLVSSAEKNLISRKISAGQVIGSAKNLEGKTVDLVAKDDLAITTFSDEKIDFKTKISGEKDNLKRGENVGKIEDVQGGRAVEIIAKEDLSEPSFFWKISHPFAR